MFAYTQYSVRIAAVVDQLLPLNLRLALTILRAAEPVPPEYEEVLKKIKAVHTKYLVWALKQLKAGADPEDLLQVIAFFHKNNQRFQVKDIGAYKTVKDLEEAARTIPQESKTKQKSKAKIEGATKVFENDRFLMLHIKSKKASVCYGSGTKWCITMEEGTYFESYSFRNVIFYFVVSKQLPPDNPLHKVAFAVYRNEKNEAIRDEIFDAEDNQLKSCPAHMTHLLELAYKDAPKQSGIDPSPYLNSKDDNVRMKAARRVDPKLLVKMVNDPSEGVRATVASRLNPEDLHLMVHDKSLDIRKLVVGRLAPENAHLMMEDPSGNIRTMVSKKMDPKHLHKMIDDGEESVRLNVAERIDPEYLPKMMKDPSFEVRIKVVERIDPDYLPQMMKDPSFKVRMKVENRLNRLKAKQSYLKTDRVANSIRQAVAVDNLVAMILKNVVSAAKRGDDAKNKFVSLLNREIKGLDPKMGRYPELSPEDRKEVIQALTDAAARWHNYL